MRLFDALKFILQNNASDCQEGKKKTYTKMNSLHYVCYMIILSQSTPPDRVHIWFSCYNRAAQKYSKEAIVNPGGLFSRPFFEIWLHCAAEMSLRKIRRMWSVNHVLNQAPKTEMCLVYFLRFEGRDGATYFCHSSWSRSFHAANKMASF